MLFHIDRVKNRGECAFAIRGNEFSMYPKAGDWLVVRTKESAYLVYQVLSGGLCKLLFVTMEVPGMLNVINSYDKRHLKEETDWNAEGK